MKGLLEQAGIEDPRSAGGATPPLPVGAAPSIPPAGRTVPSPPEQPAAVSPEAAGKAAMGGEFNQEEFDIFVANALRLVHNPGISDKLISRVADAKDPIPVVADITFQIIDRLEASAKGAGKPVSLTTVAYGANTIMGEIINSAEAAGMKKMDDKAKYQAFSLAVAKYLDESVKSGKIGKEELIQMGRQAEESPMGQKMAEMAMKQAGPNAGSVKPTMP